MKIRENENGRREFISVLSAAAAMILGAGRLCTSQEAVRSAFQYAFENIKPIDGVIVGMFPWAFNEISANVAYARELGI